MKNPLRVMKRKKQKRQGKGITTHTRTNGIKCFKCLGRGHITSQCPTKKTMILMSVDIYSSQDEQNESESRSEKSNESYIENLSLVLGIFL